MTSTFLAITAGVTVTAIVWILLKPPVRLGRRVRPYTQVAAARLLRGVDANTYTRAIRPDLTLRDFIEPAEMFFARTVGRLAGPVGEDDLATRLRQSGLYPATQPADRVAAFRTRTLLTSLTLAAVLGAVGWSNAGPVGLGIYAAGGIVLGSTVSKGRIDRAIKQRRRLMIAELYTINQILAMRARVGGGVVDALRHVANRTTGIITDEISDVLAVHRNGQAIDTALRRAATATAEPAAARLYQSLAVTHERGTDLAGSLLALARDLRTDRRDQAISAAATRRVAAVIPIVVILAPIAIAFLAAPLPSLIFGP